VGGAVRRSVCSTSALILLPVLAALTACGEPTALPSTGVLRVSIATLGDDPDLDGYQLQVDDGDPVRLDPTGIVDLDLAVGSHRLDLLGVAPHCSADPGMSRAVEVSPNGISIVTFEVRCPLTGARIAVSTRGLDRDTGGYAVEIDGIVRDSLDEVDALLLRLEPGDHEITLTGVAPNCTAEEPSRRVAIVARETMGVGFAVVCTATTGVIRVVVEASGSDLDGSYRAVVDGRSVRASYLAPSYAHVGPGPHTVSLEPPDNCTTNTPPQEVVVTAGGLVRDTVGVSFSVRCVAVSGPPPAPELLAFTTSSLNLAIIGVDGSHYLELTPAEHDQVDWGAAWSPGGDRIAFTREAPVSIHLIDSDGTNLVRLSPPGALDYGPAWSPDGRRIAFVNITPGLYTGAAWQIYIMKVDGSHRVPLTSLPGGADAPTWSPDGQKIAFVGRTANDNSNLYVMDADGKHVSPLTNGAERYYDPAWSPDGSRIVFSNADAIVLIDADGTHRTQLTSPPSGRWSYHDSGPAWSPDGKRVVFSRQYDCDPFNDIGGPSCVPNELRTIDLADPALASAFVTQGWEPDWRP
jgi:dipeptidyl aminopeptidase/acylaminoacyl peptidase